MLNHKSMLAAVRSLWLVLCLVFAVSADAQAPPPSGGDAPPPLQRGDAVVTGFAGTVAPGPDLPFDVHPLDRTTIDLDGATVRFFDLTQLGGAPEGQLSDAPVKRVLTARQIGHVFGIAFVPGAGDGSAPPDVYLTATSVHGLQLVAPGPDGRPVRVMTGRPGAEWMPGLFGTSAGGGPGTIWRVDGRTGVATRFGDIATGDLENSGAGLGSIAYDERSRHLYVSDLETGLIWRLGLDGRQLDTFDHGTEGRSAAGEPIAAYDPADRTDRTEETFNTEIPETWGFAAPERRVWGLAVQNNRLYYAVAEGPSVWSVGLEPDGSFAADARREVDVEGTPAGNQIASILFDGSGLMYLAQRGGQLGSYDYQTFMRPQEAAALRYRWDASERQWAAEPQDYAVGLPPEHFGAVGGLALNYGYDRFGRIDYARCRQTLWLTGEHLRAGSDIVRVARGGPRLVAGLQGIYKNRVKPDNEPPFEAWYVDYDASYDEDEAYGQIGNVAIYGPCAAGVTYAAERVEIPVWTRGPNLVVEKVCEPVAFGGRVRCRIVVRNIGDAVADGIVEIVDETRTIWGPGKGMLLPIAHFEADAAGWDCAPTPTGAFACRLAAALLSPGTSRSLTLWIDTGELVLAGNVGFRNCVRIAHPDGIGKACAEGGGGLTVTKSSPVVCVPGDGCKFALTVTNASPVAFAGDVVLADHLWAGGQSLEAPISAIEPPLPCAAAPTSVPFSCLAPISLAPGQSQTHWITVEMPEPAPAFVQNCFVAADPWLAAKPAVLADLLSPAKFKGLPAGAIGAHPACLWVKLAKPKQAAAPAKSPVKAPALLAAGLVPLVGLLPPPEICANGRPPLPSGRCPCPLSAPWDPETRSCRWRPVCWDAARLTPVGTCCPRGSVWSPERRACRVPPVVGCTDLARRRPDGRCCPPGLRWRNGACRPRVVVEPCRPGTVRMSTGQCVTVPIVPPVVDLPKCPDGRTRLVSGRCPPVVCPPTRRSVHGPAAAFQSIAAPGDWCADPTAGLSLPASPHAGGVSGSSVAAVWASPFRRSRQGNHRPVLVGWFVDPTANACRRDWVAAGRAPVSPPVARRAKAAFAASALAMAARLRR